MIGAPHLYGVTPRLEQHQRPLASRHPARGNGFNRAICAASLERNACHKSQSCWSPKLIVDANAVLPASQTRERFGPIPRQNREFAQLTHAIELCQCARDDVPKR